MSAQDLGPPGLSLNELLASANDAAVTARNVTTALLATAVTLAATILASSDEAIVRDQLNAPFGIGTAIRLSTAYALMPPVFLFLHVNGLLQLHVLAERLRLFEEQLQRYVGTAKDRDRWRRRLHGFAFVQHFSDDESYPEPQDRLLEYVRNLLLMSVNLTTIGIVPLALLLAAQVSFLRYQSEATTLLHRVVVLLDLAFVVWFYISQARLSKRASERPSILLIFGAALIGACWLLGFNPWLSGALLLGILTAWATSVVARVTERARFVVLLAAILGPAVWWSIGAHEAFLISWAIGFISAVVVRGIWQRVPREPLSKIAQFQLTKNTYWTVRYVPFSLLVIWFADSQAVVPVGTEPRCQIHWDWSASHSETTETSPTTIEPDEANDGLFRLIGKWFMEQSQQSNVNLKTSLNFIIKPLFGFGELDCLQKTTETDSAREAEETKIRRANLLDRWSCAAWDIGCRFISLPSSIILASSEKAGAIEKLDSISDAAKQDAVLRSLGLNLRERRLRFARLEQTRLYGVDLRTADLRGAELTRAELSGALLSDADMRQSTLDDAHLQNAALQNTDLRGASLSRTDLSGAELGGANFQGTLLESTRFNGASLLDAKFQGATLEYVQLTASSLWRAEFHGAKLESVDFGGASLESTQFQGAQFNWTTLDAAIVLDVNFEGATGTRLDLHSALVISGSFRGTSVRDVDCEGALLLSTEKPTAWSETQRDAFLQELRTGQGDKIGEQPLNRLTERLTHAPADVSSLNCAPSSDEASQRKLLEGAAKRLLEIACENEENANGVAQNIFHIGVFLLIKGHLSERHGILKDLDKTLAKPLSQELQKDYEERCEGMRDLDARTIRIFAQSSR